MQLEHTQLCPPMEGPYPLGGAAGEVVVLRTESHRPAQRIALLHLPRAEGVSSIATVPLGRVTDHPAPYVRTFQDNTEDLIQTSLPNRPLLWYAGGSLATSDFVYEMVRRFLDDMAVVDTDPEAVAASNAGLLGNAEEITGAIRQGLYLWQKHLPVAALNPYAPTPGVNDFANAWDEQSNAIWGGGYTVGYTTPAGMSFGDEVLRKLQEKISEHASGGKVDVDKYTPGKILEAMDKYQRQLKEQAMADAVETQRRDAAIRLSVERIKAEERAKRDAYVQRSVLGPRAK